MIKTIFIAILLSYGHLPVSGQVSLKIVVKNLESNAGSVILDLRDGNNLHLKGLSGEISDHACFIIVDSLKPGKYAFRYFHDENNNKEMDTYWIKVPKEGYGFSNNARARFGPPKFKKTIFELKNDTTVFCTPRYIKL